MVKSKQRVWEAGTMKISVKGRLAVTAMADIALHQAGSRPVPLVDIARRQEISLSCLEQLFAGLRRKHLVISVRGACGGYRLARNADDIHIAEIIMAFGEPAAIRRSGSGQEAQRLTDDLWDELGQRVQRFLWSLALSDVVEPRRVRQTSIAA